MLPTQIVDRLFAETLATPGYRLVVDLPNQVVRTPSGDAIPFDVDPFRKECLINGWDDIGLTLRHADAIHAYEDRRRHEQPWLFTK